MRETTPEITVVVVNYNSGDYFQGCIASLARQTRRNFETIIVDNASTDGSLDTLVEKPERFTILKQSANLSFARAKNIGAAEGKGPRRRIAPSAMAAAFTWNPFAYLGRQIDIRRFPDRGSD